MTKLIHAFYNMDANSVELTYNNGSVLTIDCEKVENHYDVTNGQMADLDWLLYNAAMEYAKLKKMLLDHAKKNGIRSGAIFITRNGKPLDRSNIWAQMKSLCEAAGVKASKVFPHNLRKLFARTFYGIEKEIAKLADIGTQQHRNNKNLYYDRRHRTPAKNRTIGPCSLGNKKHHIISIMLFTSPD